MSLLAVGCPAFSTVNACSFFSQFFDKIIFHVQHRVSQHYICIVVKGSASHSILSSVKPDNVYVFHFNIQNIPCILLVRLSLHLIWILMFSVITLVK